MYKSWLIINYFVHYLTKLDVYSCTTWENCAIIERVFYENSGCQKNNEKGSDLTDGGSQLPVNVELTLGEAIFF